MIWKKPGFPVEKFAFSEKVALSMADYIKQTIQLTMNPVPLWMLIVTAGWYALTIYDSWIVSLHLPKSGPNDGLFSLLWCSAIDIYRNVKIHRLHSIHPTQFQTIQIARAIRQGTAVLTEKIIG